LGRPNQLFFTRSLMFSLRNSTGCIADQLGNGNNKRKYLITWYWKIAWFPFTWSKWFENRIKQKEECILFIFQYFHCFQATRNLHYLMNDIRPIICRIAILLPQIICMIIWVQDLHSLHRMIKRNCQTNIHRVIINCLQILEFLFLQTNIPDAMLEFLFLQTKLN
jgi:hypothetical protein